MVEERDEKSSRFINAVDKDLRESIIRLDQKLKGLQAEINAKLEIIKDMQGDKNHEEVLAEAGKEVAKAISAIKELVNRVISEDITDKDFLKINHENIEMLRALFASHLETITELKDEF